MLFKKIDSHIGGISMPNKRQKGMVLISVATIVFLLFNVFFLSTNIKNNTIDYTASKSQYSSYNNNLSVKPFCGDLHCDYSNGETPLNCPEDCYIR